MVIEATGASRVGYEVALVVAAVGQHAPYGTFLGDEQLQRLGIDGAAFAPAVARVAGRAAAHV